MSRCPYCGVIPAADTAASDQQIQAAIAQAAWAAQVKRDAQQQLDQLPTDPDAAAHREAINRRDTAQ